MLSTIHKRIRDEAGVAMATVLLAGAAMTVLGSTAAFMTIQEFRAGSSDTRALEALSYAEAGIDRFIHEFRRGKITYNQLKRANCDGKPPMTLSGLIENDPERTFKVRVEVYDNRASVTVPANRFPPTSCSARPPGPRQPLFVAVTSTGEHPTAKRVVRQILEVKAGVLPIGIFAESIDGAGTGSMQTITALSSGDFDERDKVGFVGLDPYYTQDDFYQNGNTSPIPAAPHVVGTLYLTASSQGSPTAEHGPTQPSPNCTANGNSGTRGQSLWDGDKDGKPLSTGCAGQTGRPPTSLFTGADLQRVAPETNLAEDEYQALRESAKDNGIYCAGSANSLACRIRGVPSTTNVSRVFGDADVTGLGNNFVAFFDMVGSNPDSSAQTIKWKARVEPCSSDPAVHRSIVLIVRNGSLSMQNGAYITGAVLVPEGTVDSEGGYTIHGTVIARRLVVKGTANHVLTPCWIENMPGPFLDVRLHRWSEVDR